MISIIKYQYDDVVNSYDTTQTQKLSQTSFFYHNAVLHTHKHTSLHVIVYIVATFPIY